MGTMMAYGPYVPGDSHIGSTVLTIVALDTFVAVAAGLAIFPLVFVNGLEVGQGPGLMFVTLPLAFGQLPMGALFGTVFFCLGQFCCDHLGNLANRAGNRLCCRRIQCQAFSGSDQPWHLLLVTRPWHGVLL